MNLADLVQGYFQKTDEQKQEIVMLCTRYYIEDMIVAGGNLPTLKLHLQLLQKRSLENEHYEVSEVLGEIINGINVTLQEDGM